MTPTTADAVGEGSPTMSRRHAAGADGARGLLFTVLGEFALPHRGPIPTAAIIDVLGRLDIEEKAARQALARTAADGWLVSARHGRRTLWSLSDSAVQLLTDGAERIYSFAGRQVGWDGRWLLVLVRVPETERSARHLLRTRLTWAGFGSPAPGVWISTHLDRVAEAQRVLNEAGLLKDAQIFLAERHGGGELATMIRQAWDLEAIEERYEEFLVEYARQPSRDRLVRVIQLVHAWRRFPQIDPALPAELLPERWSGARAAALFRRQHAKWSADATAQWRETIVPGTRG
ncbi:PaaX family transcriptional regulator [Rhizocola hellebori]|uniref:PaaX family transcriptional regulator n=1 Tax=Rhizocola hellebori TaxID=1392758 RepID=A0A8J3VDY2_9ACTN|nr:PaaX family transcriptional regulator C-terminal domain-containing protein [Rhizocola hellebori]GIH03999.1 PaaX family transcriptional regulator [Rhizocola hellebori]